ncbi:hypothetical protein WNY58_12805 [Neptuniibacter pectenicola]|jgi:hypothetical protein|uniref:Secreted protein n=1 Tax=Neptuniibacter pectenicola TaxID=1806669 RepID=A0ABU9TU70_9GAMM|nr:hypothetical protein [Neptuniibacter pectenicola]KXJ53874.1 MAG: hypothetical protein AXW15_09110 [Neptuniibacter sp. Phe_28]
MKIRISLLVFVVTVLITLCCGRYCSTLIAEQADQRGAQSTQSMSVPKDSKSEGQGGLTAT